MYNTKEKQKEWNRQDYKKHPEFYRRKGALNRYKREDSIKQLLKFLKNRPCMDCQGWFEPYQMQFDHRDPKTKSFTIGRAVSIYLPARRVAEEAKKCDLVCANCHAARTHKQREAGMFHSPRKYIL